MTTPDLYSVIDKIHTSLWLVYEKDNPELRKLVCKATWKKYDDVRITFIGLNNGQLSLSQLPLGDHDLNFARNSYTYYKDEHGREVSALVIDQDGIIRLLKKYKCTE